MGSSNGLAPVGVKALILYLEKVLICLNLECFSPILSRGS